MTTVVARALKTPRCSRNLLRSQVPRQRPLRCGFATSTLRSCCAPPPSPAAPTQATPAKLSCPVLNPRRSRAFHAAPAPRQALAQAGCRVSRFAASVVSSIRLRKPGRSTSSCLQQAPHRLFPAAAKPGLRPAQPVRHRRTPIPQPDKHQLSSCRHPAACPEPCCALVLGLLHARAREEEKVAPASRRGHVCGTPPTTPLRPRQDSVCVVFSRKARPENTHRILPPMAARFRHVSQADPVATPYGHCNRYILSAVAKCRRFPDWTRPPPLI
jgi:hypothetical protein